MKDSGTFNVGTIQIHLTVVLHQWRTTYWATFHFEWCFPYMLCYSHNFRDYISSLSDQDLVSNTKLQFINSLLIVKCRIGYTRTSQKDRFKFCYWSYSPGSSRLQPDIQQSSFFFLRWILKSDCPFGVFVRSPRRLLRGIELTLTTAPSMPNGRPERLLPRF